MGVSKGDTRSLDYSSYELSQGVQSNYMVQNLVSVVVFSLMVCISIPHMGTLDPLGSLTP